MWVAASTREGEEALVRQAFAALGVDDALLILVPRHPQRFDEVAALVARTGFRCERRSVWAAGAADAVGMAGQALAGRCRPASTCCWAIRWANWGRTTRHRIWRLSAAACCRWGGQNLIEACAVGVPVLIGPHVFNFTQATADAVAAGAAVQVPDPAGLAHALRDLFGDKPRRTRWAGRVGVRGTPPGRDGADGGGADDVAGGVRGTLKGFGTCDARIEM